jgi:hypothetical protein
MNNKTVARNNIAIVVCWFENNTFYLDVKVSAFFGHDETEELRSIYEKLTEGKPCKR